MLIPRMKYIILLLPLLSLSACESDVKDVLLPEFNQKMVVTGFISPGNKEMTFTVSLNKKIYGELNFEEPFRPSRAFLSDGSTEVELEPAVNGFRIGSEIMPFESGKTYLLRISDGNELSVESTCTVPFRRDFHLKADTFSYENTFDIKPGYYYIETTRNVKVSFTDFPSEKNYYRVAGEVTNFRTIKPSGEIISSKYALKFDKEFLTDNLRDGNVLTLNSEDNIYYTANGDSSFLKVYLLNTEESYYLYHKSIMDHNYDENPFAEATPVYSNIKGGLGVFTSYTIDSVILRLK